MFKQAEVFKDSVVSASFKNRIALKQKSVSLFYYFLDVNWFTAEIILFPTILCSTEDLQDLLVKYCSKHKH